MKIRQGFVSNSSSSSFIVSLPKRIEKYTYKEFCKLVGGDSQYAQTLYDDLMHPSENEWRDYISINIESSTLNRKQIEQIEAEAKSFIVKKICQEWNKNSENNLNIYEVEYGDEGGGPGAYMEHSYMPSLKITKEIINHH